MKNPYLNSSNPAIAWKKYCLGLVVGTYLLSMLLMASPGQAQEMSTVKASRGEFAVGGAYLYERNWGVRAVGLMQEGQIYLSPFLSYTAGIGVVQAIEIGGSSEARRLLTGEIPLITTLAC